MSSKKNPMLWFTLANVVAFSPIVIGTLGWITSLTCVARFAVGVLVGLLLSALFYLAHLHRSHLRRAKALCIAQLCHTNALSFFHHKAAPSWIRQQSDYEEVNWLNTELEEIWPSLNEAASGLLKVILQSVLDPYRFSIIQKIIIKSVTLGTVSPLLGGVKFSGGGEDEAVLEVGLDWRHGQDGKIVIQLQTTGPLLTVQGDYSYLKLKPVGQLKVELVEAQSVAKADIWGESDPYALIYIRRKQGCICTSSTVMNTNCPVWNETFALDVEDPESQKLTIQLFDYDRFKSDDFIGVAELTLSQFEPNAQQDIWIDLTDGLDKTEQKSRGKVHLRILYKPLPLEKANDGELIMAENFEEGREGAVMPPQEGSSRDTVEESKQSS